MLWLNSNPADGRLLVYEVRACSAHEILMF